MGVKVAGFSLTLASSNQPAVGEGTQRLHVAARALRGELGAGDYKLAVQGLEGTAYRSAGVQQLGGTLLVLPLASVPAAEVALRLEWTLPGGRRPADHHLFPAAPLREGLQAPMFVSGARAAAAGHRCP